MFFSQEFYSFRSQVQVFNPFQVLSPVCRLGALVKHHLIIHVRIYFWALCSVPLIYMFVFMPVSYCFNYCSFVICFEISDRPLTLFFFRILLAIQGPLRFHMHFRMVFFYFFKNATRILIGITLNLQLILGSMDILTILSLPIHEHGMSFHSFVSSLISFSNVLSFLGYKSFTFLVKIFIPKYFILFSAIVNGI